MSYFSRFLSTCKNILFTENRENISKSQKRKSTECFEVTDDEEENINPSLCKRMKTTENPENIFDFPSSSYSSSLLMDEISKKYPTRGSGISPFIPGLSKQPWEFNIHGKSGKYNKYNIDEASTSSYKVMNNNPTLNSFLKSNEYKNSFNSNQTKEIEVITIEDDDISQRKEVKDFTKKAFDIGIIKNIKQLQIRPVFKEKERLKQNSSLERSYKPLGQRYTVGIRRNLNMKKFHDDKEQYMKLLNEKLGLVFRCQTKQKPDPIQSPFNKEKKESKTLLTNILKDWDVSSKSSADTYNYKVKLYSVNDGSSLRTPIYLKSKIESKPEVITLDSENDNDDKKNDLKLVPLFTSTPESRICKNEQNENEALDTVEEERDEDDDIKIISARINNNSVSRINSLALEQSSCLVADKKWTKNSFFEYKERRRENGIQIENEKKALEMLKRESDAERDLADQIRRKLSLTRPIVLEEKEKAKYPEIDESMRDVIDRSSARGKDTEVLMTAFNIDIVRGDMKTLAPCQWLNDNVINFYMEMIVERGKKDASLPNVYAFTTFFYPKLMKEGYSNILKRWTRKVDIFSYDLLFFPIHLGLHWCLAVADFRNKSLIYYDSLGGNNMQCLKALLNYLSSEMKERKKVEMNTLEWDLKMAMGIPQQNNGSDCGMFTCKFAEYLSREAEPTFGPRQMVYFRERMIYEIVKKDLLQP